MAAGERRADATKGRGEPTTRRRTVFDLELCDRCIRYTVSKLIAPSDPLFRTPTDADVLDDFTAQHQRLARLQLQLPVKLGGCGITSSTTTAPLAYIAAWRGCLSFLDEHGDLFPATQDSLTPQAFAAADADADAATAGPLDFLAATWRDATLQLRSSDQPVARTHTAQHPAAPIYTLL